MQIFFFYFGIGAILPLGRTSSACAQPFIDNVEWAIIALSLFAGAFNVEIFRSGIEAVPKTTRGGGGGARLYAAQGLYLHVILPLALRVIACRP